jgi:hypothetical protein
MIEFGVHACAITPPPAKRRRVVHHGVPICRATSPGCPARTVQQAIADGWKTELGEDLKRLQCQQIRGWRPQADACSMFDVVIFSGGRTFSRSFFHPFGNSRWRQLIWADQQR